MSLPWLQDDFKDSSRSRSRSPLNEKELDKNEKDTKEKVLDTSAQSSPQKPARKFRTRSSRSRSSSNRRNSRRSQSRHSDRKKGGNPRHSKRKKRSSSSGSRSSPSYSTISSSSGSVPTRAIASTHPRHVKARLLVTNIVSKEIRPIHLTNHFKKYGDVIDVIIHVKNYAFIQFAKEEHAQDAIEGERGKTFRGWHLGVSLASERPKNAGKREAIFPDHGLSERQPRGPKKRGRRRRGAPPPHQGGPLPPSHLDGPYPGPPHKGPFPPPHFDGPFPPPHGGPYPPPHGGPFPPHGGPFPPHGGPYLPRGPYPPRGGPFPPPHGGPYPPPHGGPFPPFYRGPGPDSFHGRGPGPFGPGPGDFRAMDPYFKDPNRQGPMEPFRDDVPLRPNAFEGSHRRAVKPAECEIFIMHESLRHYGEYVEERIKNFKMSTAVYLRPENVPPTQLLEDLKNQKVLFAIFIAAQNEAHLSMTLNILHGSPQEHRNMPVDDAVKFIVESFQKYAAPDLTEKENRDIPRTSLDRSSSTFLPAPVDVSDLINLLADNRNLTVEELDTIILYLTKRRNKLVGPKGRLLGSKDKSPTRGRMSPDNPPESRHRSLDSRHRSLDSRHRSPVEGHQMSLEKDHRRDLDQGHRRSLDEGRWSPDEGPRRSLDGGRRQLPEDYKSSSRYRRSPGEGRRQSPGEDYRKSPSRYSRSPDRYRKPPPLDYDELSQSPKEKITAASLIPTSLTEDLKSKILSILNSARIAQSVPPAEEAQQQSDFLATATQAQLAPPPPLPPILPSLPANEFANSGAQDSGNMFQKLSGLLNTGFLDNMQGSNPVSAASQQMGASNFASSLGAVNDDGYQQGTWQGVYDESAWLQPSEHNWRRESGMQQTAPGTTGMAYQEPYNYSGSNSQIGNNYGQPRY